MKTLLFHLSFIALVLLQVSCTPLDLPSFSTPPDVQPQPTELVENTLRTGSPEEVPEGQYNVSVGAILGKSKTVHSQVGNNHAINDTCDGLAATVATNTQVYATCQTVTALQSKVREWLMP